jgi:hypothetical protein
MLNRKTRSRASRETWSDKVSDLIDSSGMGYGLEVDLTVPDAGLAEDVGSAITGSLSVLERILYRIEDVLRPPAEVLPESEREDGKLPPEGPTISVEMALNSRCSSDYDGNPRKFHWGMFDRTRAISEKDAAEIVALAQIPRFTAGEIRIERDHSLLTFLIDGRFTNTQERWTMVESGMQQQAVGLMCSALGAGWVPRSQGKDGFRVSEERIATLKAKLGAARPTYDGSYWTDMTPSGRSAWRRGSLPDPVRDGSEPLLATLASLTTRAEGSQKLTPESMGQLLWAARGRTPHLYKSRPWGLTIPTWGGEQNLTGVYVISDGQLAKYINWRNHRPTHSLEEQGQVDQDLSPLVGESGLADRICIVLARNETFNRSLWEVGYQLLNILLQAKALDLSYQAVLLDEDQGRLFETMEIGDPVAIVLL